MIATVQAKRSFVLSGSTSFPYGLCVCVCVTVVSVCVIVPMPFGGQLRAADLRFTITGSGCSDEKSRRQLAGMGSIGLLMEISLDVSSRHRFRVLYVTRCGY